jgi:hypothetical protein
LEAVEVAVAHLVAALMVVQVAVVQAQLYFKLVLLLLHKVIV